MALRTLLQCRNDVRSHLDESTARQWLDAELNRWINEAARDIARRAETIQATSTTAAVIGTRTYALTAAILRLNRVEWVPTAGGITMPLEYRDFNSMDGAWLSAPTRQGDPMYFTLWGFPPTLTMYVYPVPAAAGNLVTYHYREPTEAVADGDSVEIPEGWYDLATIYSEAMALRKDGDPRWQEANGLYEGRLAALIAASRRWSDAPDSNMLARMAPTDRIGTQATATQGQGQA